MNNEEISTNLESILIRQRELNNEAIKVYTELKSGLADKTIIPLLISEFTSRLAIHENEFSNYLLEKNIERTKENKDLIYNMPIRYT